MKKYKRLAAMAVMSLLVGMVMFAGCSNEEQVHVPVTSNTIELTSEGRVIAYIVEDFDKDYYDINELKNMVNGEIAEYNKEKAFLVTEAGRTPVIVDSVTMAEDGSKNAVVALNFQNASIYEDYMGKELFYGTVNEAVAAGYDVDMKLSKVKNGELFTGEQVSKNGEKSILILADTVNVRTAGKVQYLSVNATLTEEGFVDCTSNEELKYIIMK